MCIKESDFSLALSTNGIAVLKSFLSVSEVKTIKDMVTLAINEGPVIRRSGPNKIYRNDYVRLDCGDYDQCNSRLSIMTTFFPWGDRIKSSPLEKVVRFRDYVLNINTTIDHVYHFGDKKLYSLNKVLFYPAGGGFMNEHCDSYNNEGFPNFLVCLSDYGHDYKNGGAYYKINGSKILIDQYIESGDLYAHMPSIFHGVSAINSDDILDPYNSSVGRFVVNCSLENVDYE